MENCFYCGTITDNVDYFYTHRLYQIIKINKFPVGYKYNHKDILIPRCKICCVKHEKFDTSIFIPVFLVGFITFIILFYFNHNSSKYEWWYWLFYIFLAFSFSSLIATIFVRIFESLLFKKIFSIPKEDDIKEFGAVKKLLSLNWQFYKRDPSAVSNEDIAKDSPYYNEDY